MFIASPETALGFAQKEEGRLKDGLHYWFRIQRDVVADLLKHRDRKPTESQLASAVEFLGEITSLAWTVEQVNELLCLYPRARINLAVTGDANEELSFAAAHFFLGASWPTFGDNVDIDAFEELLQKQALLMGFSKAN